MNCPLTSTCETVRGWVCAKHGAFNGKTRIEYTILVGKRDSRQTTDRCFGHIKAQATRRVIFRTEVRMHSISSAGEDGSSWWRHGGGVPM